MNDNFTDSLFDSSEDDVLSRAIDRFADGECSAAEEAQLFDRLESTPGGWKLCALALAEVRDLRTALAVVGRSRSTDHGLAASRTLSISTEERTVTLSSPRTGTGAAGASNRRRFVPWSAMALGVVLSFAAGFAVASRQASDAPALVGHSRDQGDEKSTKPRDAIGGRTAEGDRTDQVAADGGPEAPDSAAREPEYLNVVYRPSGDAEESSARLPMYQSDEDWARVIDQAVRQSEADLAERRTQLLRQGADLERHIVLHPIDTEQGEMLLPVETFQIVPVSLNSFH